MTDRARKRELRERFEAIEVGAHAEERMLAGIDRALPPRRAAVRRPLLIAIAAAVLMAVATAAALALWLSRDVTVPATDTGRAGIAESPVLGDAPWLLTGQSGMTLISEAPRLQAVRFPPGTTYREATRALFLSVVQRGEIPRGGRLAEPTALGVVWSVEDAGPRLDLRAPYGYDPRGGAIRPPSYSLPASTTPADAQRLAVALEQGTPTGALRASGLVVDTPRLATCQRRAPGLAPRTCPAARVAE